MTGYDARAIGAYFSPRLVTVLTICVCTGAFQPHALFGKAPALRSVPRNMMLSAISNRPLVGLLPLKSGPASAALSKQSFVGTSRRLKTDFGWSNIALKAGKQPKDTPPQEEDDDENEAPEVLLS